MSEYNSASLVRYWIQEHACKFRMSRVIAELQKKKLHITSMLCKDCAELRSFTRPTPCFDPSFMVNMLFCNMLELFASLLKRKPTLEALLKVDINQLVQAADLLDVLYGEVKCITFSAFNKLQSVFKILSLILRIVREESKPGIMQHLDELYPPYSEERLIESIQKYGISDSLAREYQLNERKSRVFILQLQLGKEKRDHYIQTKLIPDVEAYLQTAQGIIPDVIAKGIKPNMTATAIEKIIHGGMTELRTIKDPAIQIFLEYIQPQVQEEDLLTVLTLLEPDTPVTNELIEVDEQEEVLENSPKNDHLTHGFILKGILESGLENSTKELSATAKKNKCKSPSKKTVSVGEKLMPSALSCKTSDLAKTLSFGKENVAEPIVKGNKKLDSFDNGPTGKKRPQAEHSENFEVVNKRRSRNSVFGNCSTGGDICDENSVKVSPSTTGSALPRKNNSSQSTNAKMKKRQPKRANKDHQFTNFKEVVIKSEFPNVVTGPLLKDCSITLTHDAKVKLDNGKNYDVFV